jgi:hypothetical protein
MKTPARVWTSRRRFHNNHGLKDGIHGRVWGEGQLLHHPIKRDLVLQRSNYNVSDSVEQLFDRRVAAQVCPQYKRRQAVADHVLDIGGLAKIHHGAEDNVILVAYPMQ